MITNTLEIICVGNSHLASFSQTLRDELNGLDNISLKFWPVQYMVNQWDDFNSNSYLTKPKFKPDNPAGLPIVGGANDKNSVLVLVGLGLSGNHIFNKFGGLSYLNPDEVPNGYSASPLMPITSGDIINKASANNHLAKRNAEFYSNSMCKEMFKASIDVFLNKLKAISLNSYYKNVFCIPAPNMPDQVARWRLGNDYCESASQRVLNDIYRNELEESAVKLGVKNNLIEHDVSFENQFGFIENSFAASEKLNDNHTNKKYYEHIVKELVGKCNV
jgi:hypothetical protein